MKTGDIKNIKPAKKYSNALISSAFDNNNAKKVYEDILFISETIKTNKLLLNLLYNPVVTLNDKTDIVKKIFSSHVEKISLDFILLLLENNRINILDEVINQYEKEYNLRENIIKPTVISAVELKENQKENIKNKLEKKLSKKVIPEYKVLKDIIGGLIIEIEDKTIDCSLKTKFENMKKQLTKGNNYGNN